MDNHDFLRVTGVDKIFTLGKGIEVTGVQNISLSVSKGEFIVISGPSGSGKTTLLNMIGGLDSVSSGTIYLENLCITRLAEKDLSIIRRDAIGFVFQAYNLIPVLTAKENIEYVLKLQHIGQEECTRRSLEVAEILGIAELLDKLPNQLSGGQQQRVAVARAVAPRPKLILADEPTANLDSKSAVTLIDMMQDLNNRFGITIIFASHDPMIIKKAQRSIVMQDGKIVSDLQ